MKAFFAICAVLVICCVGAQEAVLIVQKSFPRPTEFALGHNATVQIRLINVGDSDATDVHVKDSWPATFKVVEGQTEATFDKIEAGTWVWNNFTVTPTATGPLQGFPAVVTYKSAGKEQTCYSTQMYNATVFAESQLGAKHWQEWTVFGLGAGASILMPLLVWVVVRVKYTNCMPNLVKSE